MQENNQILPTEPLVRVDDLCKFFRISRNQTLKAVNHVSFHINKGETVGMVGESGCGKSTTGRCMVKLYEPTSGHVYYKGQDIFAMNKAQHREFTGNVQMIFQNPYSSLNPRMTVKDIVGEGMKLHGKYTPAEMDARVEELLGRVGLGRAHMSRFPHEFSGGQRQRIGIARALSVNPEFIVCDEPVSALDVSIQAQIINMLKKLQEEMNLTYLFVAHDLSVVKYISDRVVVMYLGSIVEEAPADELYSNPLHPYTQVLLSAIPIADPVKTREKERIAVKGEIPSPINPRECCQFAERCPYAAERCRQEIPVMRELEKGHRAACHLLD
ncbi:MAG: ABC transporter ATP-binding protein [Lachnospiraceae bacterium]